MKRLRWMLCMLFIMLPITTWAGVSSRWFKSGNSLIAGMHAYDQTEGNDFSDPVKNLRTMQFCSYIMGVVDATPQLDNGFYLPQGANSDQVCSIVSKYFKKHPELWADNAAKLVILSLQQAFPVKDPSDQGAKK